MFIQTTRMTSDIIAVQSVDTYLLIVVLLDAELRFRVQTRGPRNHGITSWDIFTRLQLRKALCNANGHSWAESRRKCTHDVGTKFDKRVRGGARAIMIHA
jgi:hypothetical protein